MKKCVWVSAWLILAAMLFSCAALAESAATAEDFGDYAGCWYACDDPWDGRFYVTVESVEDGKMTWSFSDVFYGATVFQSIEGALSDEGVMPFHVEGTALYDENQIFSYDGSIALKDGAVELTFTAGQLEELSEEGGSTSHHVQAIGEPDRTFVLGRRGAVPAEAIELFSDTWVDDGIAAEIWYDGGTFHCRSVLGNGGDESDVIEYTFAEYDEAADALICEGGTRTHEKWDNGSQELLADTVATGLTAKFTVDGQDVLTFSDSEGLCADYALQRLSVAGDGDAAYEALPPDPAGRFFEGEWVCDRARLSIRMEADAYRCVIDWAGSAWDEVEWVYECQYDDWADNLFCSGTATKTELVYAEDGSVASADLIYDDGDAVFSLDENGMLIWEDRKENAGEGMAFERVG